MVIALSIVEIGLYLFEPLLMASDSEGQTPMVGLKWWG